MSKPRVQDKSLDVWSAIASREIRSTIPVSSLVEAFLARIASDDSTYRAFISVTAENARSDAKRADEAREVGKPLPLDGLPLAVKDCIDVSGAPSTVGSDFFRANVARRDAEAVRRLRKAGAVVLGKANMHEFAFGGTTNNPFYGTCRNPWDLDRIPGGSSGGSAVAVAAALCCGALGTDTGGSVRVPAGLNGITGLRPTYGLVSCRGVFPLSRTFDSVGPMARSVSDVAAMLAVMAGFDERDPRSVQGEVIGNDQSGGGAGLNGVRIGIPTGKFYESVEPEVAAAIERALDTFRALGASVIGMKLAGAELASSRSNPIIWSEAFAVHRTRMDQQPERFGEDTHRRLILGSRVTGGEFADALQGMFEWQRSVERTFHDFDIIATPTTARAAPRIDDAETVSVTADVVRFNHQWSLAHVPALVLPCGFTGGGLPIGLQLVASKWRDAFLLRVGEAFQEATDWHLRRPREISSVTD